MALAAGQLAGCGEDGNTSPPASSSASSSGEGAGGSGVTTSTAHGGGQAGGGFSFDAGTTDGGLSEDAACAQASAEAELVKKPVDIIWVIDNSGSMGQEAAGVEDNINNAFAQIIEASGIDYRVIIVARHGKSNTYVCVEEPLSGIPVGGCSVINNTDPPVNKPPKFFHYSEFVASHDSLCELIKTYDGTNNDDFGLAPSGWQVWLRPDAFKVFVEVTDDGISCSANSTSYNDGPNLPNASHVPAAEAMALSFDTNLLALSPQQFGTAQERNYIWHSLIGVTKKDPQNPKDPWLPSDPFTFARCNENGNSAVSSALGYQALSKLTGGLRFSLCDDQNYDVVFNEIAKGVIEGAVVECEFALPEPPPGETLDLDTVVVEYTPGGNGTPEQFEQVKDAGACGPDKFYIEMGTIKLCPDACTKVQADDSAKLVVLFGCDQITT